MGTVVKSANKVYIDFVVSSNHGDFFWNLGLLVVCHETVRICFGWGNDKLACMLVLMDAYMQFLL